MNPKDFIKIHENNVDDPLVIIYKEAPNTSKPQVNDFMDYLEEISKKKDFHIIIDLSDTKPPSADVRATLKLRFEKLNHKIISYQVYIGTNILLKIAAKFVGASLGLRNFITQDSIELAIDHIKRKF